ncbi:MerR family transcriptional regulator [Prauserella oleivorans]|uniref:MerR family transcriptional regulator n=1 Tax=Prauserella oleivorans TaxID=1478153 RepID=A0ABW5WGU0_9PSEU
MAEYRVDELARIAGTTVGNIRVYQDRDVLPKPLRKGRVALYTDAHLARLRLVLGLLKRGYTFAQIRELIAAWESGRGLEDLLGLDEALTAPFSDEPPRRLSREDLSAQLGQQADRATLERLERIGVCTRDGEHVVVHSPRMLHTTRELRAAGVPVDATLDAAAEVRTHTDRIASVFGRLLDTHVLPGDLPTNGEAAEVRHRVGALRPVVQAAVGALLALSMSRVLHERLGVARRYPERR